MGQRSTDTSSAISWSAKIPASTSIRLCFLDFFANIFSTFELCVLRLRSFPHPVAVFDSIGYKKQYPQYSAILDSVLESQAFFSFLDQQHQVRKPVLSDIVLFVAKILITFNPCRVDTTHSEMQLDVFYLRRILENCYRTLQAIPMILGVLTMPLS